MSFPKKGKFFPTRRGSNLPPIDPLTFASVISLALMRARSDRQVSIKNVANWTGANERTVKNWFSGRFGPSGDHLMVLANHCDEVMEAIIRMSGHGSFSVCLRLEVAEKSLVAALKLVREIRRQNLQDNEADVT